MKCEKKLEVEFGADVGEGALGTAGGAFGAGLFGVGVEEGVVFFEEGYVGREVVHEEVLELVVGGVGCDEAEPGHDAAGEGVYDKDGMLGDVEEDGVGGFGADAVQGEELGALGGEVAAAQVDGIAVVFSVEKVEEDF